MSGRWMCLRRREASCPAAPRGVVHTEDGTTPKYFVSCSSVTAKADASVQLMGEEAVMLDMLTRGRRQSWSGAVRGSG